MSVYFRAKQGLHNEKSIIHGQNYQMPILSINIYVNYPAAAAAAAVFQFNIRTP
jgi:hypothetical protein